MNDEELIDRALKAYYRYESKDFFARPAKGCCEVKEGSRPLTRLVVIRNSYRILATYRYSITTNRLRHDDRLFCAMQDVEDDCEKVPSHWTDRYN